MVSTRYFLVLATRSNYAAPEGTIGSFRNFPHSVVYLCLGKSIKDKVIALELLFPAN